MMCLIQISKMKTLSILYIFLFLACPAFAVLISEFTSWNDLIGRSPDIIIARCTMTPDFTSPGSSATTRWTLDDVVHSDIEVIDVLKGNTKPGLSHLGSFYKPHQGDMFAILGQFSTYQLNSWYNAVEDYRIIPLKEDFDTNKLTGKTLDEQMKIILTARLCDLNDELAKANTEKNRIESGLKEDGSTNSLRPER